MKIFKASSLSHNRSEVMKAAREEGAIIQECRTNGEVIQEYVLIKKCDHDELLSQFSLSKSLLRSE